MTRRGTVGWVLLFVLTLLSVGEYMWLYLFSRDLSLDEGYLMISVQGFLQGRPLYDETFSQYGPFHYLVRALQHGAMGLPLTHDSVRLVTLVTWLLAAALIALAVGRVSRSVFLGWMGFLASVTLLSPLAHEPGHPQEVIALLLALLSVLAMRPNQTPVGWLLIGSVVAALALIKINVGAFVSLAVISMLLLMSLHAPYARRLCAVAVAAVPAILLHRHLHEGWALQLVLIASTAILLPSLLIDSAVDPTWRGPLQQRTLVAVGAGALGSATLVLAFALWWGSSPEGLVRGLIIQPLALASRVVLPPEWPWWAPVNLAAAVLAFILQVRSALPRTPLALGVAKAGFGVAVVLFAGGDGAARMAALGPWLWILLLPMPGQEGAGASSAHGSARPLIVLLAAWQLLQVYPIAGSQLAIAALLLVPAGLLGLHEGITVMRAQVQRSRAVVAPPAVLMLVCCLMLAASVFGQLRITDVRRQYREATPLALPGSGWVRASAEEVVWYQALSGFLPQQGDTFVSVPGVNSLYFWSGLQPPTALNVTEWSLLEDSQIADIVAALKSHRRPLVVVVVPALEDWQAADRPAHALAAYVLRECTELGRVGPFVIFRGDGQAAAPSS